MYFYTVIDRPNDDEHVLYIRYTSSTDVEMHRLMDEFPIEEKDIPRVARERIYMLDAAHDGGKEDTKTPFGDRLEAEKWVAYHIPREAFK